MAKNVTLWKYGNLARNREIPTFPQPHRDSDEDDVLLGTMGSVRMEVTFSLLNPFFDRISTYAVDYATPVFFGESPYSSYAAKLANGTATLVKFENRFCAVTCWHVIDGYRRSRAEGATAFQIGPFRMDPEEHLIGEDEEFDLAVLDLTSLMDRTDDLGESKFVRPVCWPPQSVSTTDILCLGGFPGIWREQADRGYLRFYSFSSGTCEVRSVRDNQIVTTVQIEDCISQIRDDRVWGSLGGLSGGPVFVWRKTPILVAELVGFIYEYQETLI